MKFLITLFTATLAAAAAQAHEFSVTLLVPPGAEEEARRAFLLASSERDSHPDETSEGHLGGLDSQLEIVVAGPLAAPVLADIVVAIGPGMVAGDFHDLGSGPVYFSIPDPDRLPETAPLNDGSAPFSTRYVDMWAQEPGDVARYTYLAARRIETAIRELGGVSPREALVRLLDAK